MSRSFYTLLAALVTIALTGCAGPALWFSDEVLANRHEKVVAEAQVGDEEEPDNEVAGAKPAPASDIDSGTAKSVKASQTEGAQPAKQSEVRSNKAHPPVKTAVADGGAIPSKLDTEQRVTHGTALSKTPIEEARGDLELAAEIEAMGFDDPGEEAAALAAVQAAPAVHRSFLLRTMQASLIARQQADDRANVAPRRLQPALNSAPQKMPSKEIAASTASDKPAPERRLERFMDENAVVAMEVERIEQVEPVEDRVLLRDGERHGVQKEAPRNSGQDAEDEGELVLRDDQDWQAYADEAVVALEEQVGIMNEEKDPVDQARLRLLYLITGRRDEALAAMEGVSAAEKEFWSKELYALGALFDETQPDRTRRAALASEHLRQAADRLGELGGLVVKSLHFCTEVKGYGTFSAFAKDEFRSGQEVLLYCEVENFQSKLTDRGYHTALKGRYQIFDASGNVVAEKDLSLKEEHCQNKRRDFFIPYFVWMPKQVPPGRYQLKLTIEDVHAQQMAESTIEFVIKEK